MTNKVRYFVLIAAFLILIAELYMADYNNFFGWKNLLKLLVPICLIISMYGSIRHVNKHGEN